jgi:peptidoglycan-N-acetylglucosamine deacetylase
MPQVLVTTSWDDGDVLDLRLAEIMDRHGVRGTFYIPGNAKLRGEGLRALAAAQEVGGHTLSHSRVDLLSRAEAKREVEEGKAWLEDQVGEAVHAFCYPWGQWSDDAVEVVRDAGFSYARTVERFQFGLAEEPLLNGTTCQTLPKKSDVFRTLGMRHGNPLALRYLLDWGYFARQMFYAARRRGGVFHFWGHSWEVDRFGQWDRLDDFFAFLSRQPDVAFVTNSELLRPRGDGAPTRS